MTTFPSRVPPQNSVKIKVPFYGSYTEVDPVKIAEARAAPSCAPASPLKA